MVGAAAGLSVYALVFEGPQTTEKRKIGGRRCLGEPPPVKREARPPPAMPWGT
jgi:hypothetical protein